MICEVACVFNELVASGKELENKLFQMDILCKWLHLARYQKTKNLQERTIQIKAEKKNNQEIPKIERLIILELLTYLRTKTEGLCTTKPDEVMFCDKDQTKDIAFMPTLTTAYTD